MDFSTLDIGLTQGDTRAVTVTTIKPQHQGKPVLNGHGEQLELHVIPLTSPEGMREFRKVNYKFDTTQLQGARTEATEEELDKLADLDEASGLELASRLLTGWNLKTSTGEAIECSLENRTKFLTAFPLLASVVSSKAMNSGDELGKSAKA